MLSSELTGLGLHPYLAKGLGFVATTTGLSGAGSSNTDATAIGYGVSQFSTVNSSTGAIVPTAANGGPIAVINNGSNALLVYPAAGEQMNNGTATTVGYSIGAGKTALLIPAVNRWICTLST